MPLFPEFTVVAIVICIALYVAGRALRGISDTGDTRGGGGYRSRNGEAREGLLFALASYLKNKEQINSLNRKIDTLQKELPNERIAYKNILSQRDIVVKEKEEADRTIKSLKIKLKEANSYAIAADAVDDRIIRIKRLFSKQFHPANNIGRNKERLTREQVFKEFFVKIEEVERSRNA